MISRMLDNQAGVDSARGRALGAVVRGSLIEGLEARLNAAESVESLRAGRFVVVEGEQFEFFSLITDVKLAASNPQILLNPPGPDEKFAREALAGTGVYGTVSLRPMLMMPKGESGAPGEEEPLPVKTIPGHFSPVHDASAGDVSRVFGSAQEQRYFEIGAPLEMDDTPVCLNLDRFVERSNAIFGKSGTGKTFLTRICLCGLIKQEKAVNLVFDMHSEYGWHGTSEDAAGGKVRGLKQYFEQSVLVYTLDPESSRRRGVKAENHLRIPFSQITVEDVVLLERELNLTSTAVETGYLLVNRFGQNWLAELLKMDGDALKEFADENNAHAGAVAALKRKLERLRADCQGFLVENLPQPDDAVDSILSALKSEKHVIVEFGQYNRPVQYMLVANILTRRIHSAYVKRREEAMGAGGARGKPLVITIEEAHKFLSPALASQTIFGTIAREMRKYDVTLLIVDQRPSGIDDEALSQVGTKLICLLDDDRDMEAVLTGTPNASGLRSILASLDTKQQALLLGHAVPMPIVIKTRTYDDERFRKAMLPPLRSAVVRDDRDFPS